MDRAIERIFIARITSWKEKLSHYNTDVTYKPRKDHLMPDWLSHAIIINEIKKSRGEMPGDVRQFL